MKTQNSFKRMIAIAFALFAIVSTALADWTTYDCSTTPEVYGFSAGSSSDFGGDINVIADADNSGNSLLELFAPDSLKNYWKIYLTDSAAMADNGATFVTRFKALNDSTNATSFQIYTGAYYTKIYVQKDGKVKVDKDQTYTTGLDFTEYHVFRITMKGADIQLWVDDVKYCTFTTTATSGNKQSLRFGDASTSDAYSAIFDWIIWDESGVYAPGEGADYPAGYVISPLVADEVGDGDWTIFDGSETPQDFGFSESSDLYGGELANPIADPDNAGNFLIDFSTIDTVKSKYSFNQSLSIDSTKGFTVVLRAKAKSADNDMLEVTLKSGVSYEKIRFYPDEGKLNVEKGTADTRKVSYAVPEGVDMLDWNVYRFTIVDSVLNMWVNEIQVGFDIKTTYSPTTTTNFGFGEGNSGMTYASYIDWVIWDQTGAYAPGEGSDFPSSLIISPLSGGEVVIPDFFHFGEMSIDVPQAGGTTDDIALEANTDWTLVTTDSWITAVTPLAGDSGAYTFSITTKANEGAAPRSGKIYGMIGEELMDELIITQEGKAVLIPATGAMASSEQVKDGVTKAATNAIDGDNTTPWVPSEGIVAGEYQWVKVAVAPNSEVVLVKITEYKNSQRLTSFSVDYWDGSAYVESLPQQLSPLQAVDNSEVAYALPSAITTDTVMFKFYGNASTTETDPSAASGWLTISELSVWGAEASSAISSVADVTFNVYPNPSEGVFTIGNAEGADLRIISLAGQVVFEKANISINEKVSTDLPKGIYLLNVDDAVSKIVIK